MDKNLLKHLGNGHPIQIIQIQMWLLDHRQDFVFYYKMLVHSYLTILPMIGRIVLLAQ